MKSVWHMDNSEITDEMDALLRPVFGIETTERLVELLERKIELATQDMRDRIENLGQYRRDW